MNLGDKLRALETETFAEFEKCVNSFQYNFLVGDEFTYVDKMGWEYGTYQIKNGDNYLREVYVLKANKKGLYVINRINTQDGGDRPYYISFQNLSSINEQVSLLSAMRSQNVNKPYTILICENKDKILGIFDDDDLFEKAREISNEINSGIRIMSVSQAENFIKTFTDLILKPVEMHYSDVKNVVTSLNMDYTQELNMEYTQEMGDYVMREYYIRDKDETETWESLVENLLYEYQSNQTQEFHFNFRQKVTAWMNTPFVITAKNEIEAIKKAKEFCNDESGGVHDLPWDCITETIGTMSLKENEMYSTQEIVLDQNIVYQNGR